MASELAIHGGTPVRRESLPYGRHHIDADDVEAVVSVLRSDWLTTGPKVEAFERAFAEQVGTREAVAVSNGTAALHAAMFALGVEAGDEVIVPAMTFAATANSVVFQGGTPVFADVNSGTLLVDPNSVEDLISSRTKAVIAVDYAGQPCRYDLLRNIAGRHGLALVSDGAHAPGAEHQGEAVGSLADMTTFSFHPVKHVTSGEGGMVTTDDEGLADRMRRFRNHGITSSVRKRKEEGTFFYEMEDLGYNYRITDLQCALGLSQLEKLGKFVRKRREIASSYDRELQGIPGFNPLERSKDATHSYHLYVVRLDPAVLNTERNRIFQALLEEGIGVNVHYVPVHLHPYYRREFNTGPGLCPVAESAYEQIMTLPLFPSMSDQDVEDVIAALRKVSVAYTAEAS